MTDATAQRAMRHYYDEVPGFFAFKEGYKRILDWLPNTRPSIFVEVGSFAGKSLAYMGVEVFNRNLPVTIHAVDNFVAFEESPLRGDELRETFMKCTEPLREHLKDHFRLWEMSSIEASKRFANLSIDAVWIDADHQYDSVKADITAWFPKVRAGGIMGGDDFMMEPVARAVCEEFAPNYVCGHGEAGQPDAPYPWLWWLMRKDDTRP